MTARSIAHNTNMGNVQLHAWIDRGRNRRTTRDREGAWPPPDVGPATPITASIRALTPVLASPSCASSDPLHTAQIDASPLAPEMLGSTRSRI